MEDGPTYNNNEDNPSTNKTDNQLNLDHLKTEIKAENDQKTNDLPTSLITSQNYSPNGQLIKSENHDSELEVTAENAYNNCQINPPNEINSENSSKSTEIKDQPMEIDKDEKGDNTSKDGNETTVADADNNQSNISSNFKEDDSIINTTKTEESSENTANPVSDTPKDDEPSENKNIIDSEKEKPTIKTAEIVTDSNSDLKVNKPEIPLNIKNKVTDGNDSSKEVNTIEVENTVDKENVKMSDHDEHKRGSVAEDQKETKPNEIGDNIKNEEKDINEKGDKLTDKDPKCSEVKVAENNEKEEKMSENIDEKLSKVNDENLSTIEDKTSENKKDKEETKIEK